MVPEWLAHRARTTPERGALVGNGRPVTFAELNERVAHLAGALRERIEDGDRVGVLAENGVPYGELIHAVPRAGGILVPVNTRLKHAEMGRQLEDAGARLLIADKGHLEEARALGIEVLVAGQIEGEPFFGPERIDLSRPHSIIYTSGTTGASKGAIITHGNLWYSALASALNLGHEPSDRWLAVLPLFHVGGLSIITRGVISGIAAAIPDRFDAEEVNRAVDAGEVTILSAVSVMLRRMLEGRARPYPPSLRCVLLGGSPAPRDLLERCASLGVPVLQTYGLTETTSQAATLPPEDALRKLGSAGKPLSVTEIRIEEERLGESGEILVRGLTVSPGYHNNPEATAYAQRGGWLHTGDLGYLDEEGYLYVLDRRDDLIVSGGENIYPAEVERVLAAHPAVREACVTGMPDERWGQRPAAAIVAHGPIDIEGLRSWCQEQLAGYKIPDRIIVVENLPRNAGGKVLRRSVLEIIAATCRSPGE